jgi:hypothetical protein
MADSVYDGEVMGNCPLKVKFAENLTAGAKEVEFAVVYNGQEQLDGQL